MVASTPRSAGGAVGGISSGFMQAEMMGVMGDEDHDLVMGSPMGIFPAGAKIGSHFNCWSIPDCEAFNVRGANYLKDKKKIPSGDFLFPVRGVDLFLTGTSC
jgi:hypothetical protein